MATFVYRRVLIDLQFSGDFPMAHAACLGGPCGGARTKRLPFWTNQQRRVACSEIGFFQLKKAKIEA